MSQEEFNNTGNYQDPIATPDGNKPSKKSGGGTAVGSTVAAIVVWRLFGLIGGLICFAGFWAVYAICKSKMPLAAKIILSIVVTLVFLVLLLIFILISANIWAEYGR